MAILVGTDYNPEGIKGIGPKKALKLVKERNDYNKMFSELNADFYWKEIYELFENMDVLKKYKLKWESINAKKIRSILVDKHEFNEERVDKVISKLMESNKIKEQTGLGKWM